MIEAMPSNSSGPATSGGDELDDRVATVVGPADQAELEQPGREEPTDQPLALVVGEVDAVLGQLDAVEVAHAADLGDDRQVEQRLEGRAELALVGTAPDRAGPRVP